MAILTKGKRKGEQVKLSQWCNDWFSLEDGFIVSPGALKFSFKEMETIQMHKNNGILFNLFYFQEQEDGFYVLKKRRIQ
jgi:hypothetical protein